MEALVLFVVALVASLLLAPILIPVLKRLKFGQSILQIGPSWHNTKSGTPTMGGIIFVVGSMVALLFRMNRVDTTLLLVLLCAVGFGLVGFLDDFIKVVLKQNLGLRAWQKLVLQIAVSLGFLFVGLHFGVLSPIIDIPFLGRTLDLGLYYIPFGLFVLLAVTNSVNLTDGIDGLASSVTIVVLMFFYLVAILFPSLRLLCAASVGGLLGFWVFNRYPAKIFMGDTGSLYLGGLVAALALVMGNPLILIVVGFVYLCESLSVIIQVAAFQLTGKRVFKMSPIHHHFEMSGWTETKIVRVFLLFTMALCLICYWFA